MTSVRTTNSPAWLESGSVVSAIGTVIDNHLVNAVLVIALAPATA